MNKSFYLLVYKIYEDYYQKEKERKGSIDQENDILISVALYFFIFLLSHFLSD